MAFCPRCGTATTANMSFCTACGEMLTHATAAPPAAPGVAPAEPARPTGKPTEPWLVVLLGVITFGIYVIVFWWRAARDMDAHEGRPGHARRPIVIGTWVWLAGNAVGVVFALVALGPVMDTILSGGEVDETAISREIAQDPFYWVGLGLTTLGAAIFLVGAWRTWTLLAEAESRRGRSDPLNPTLAVVPMAGVVATRALNNVLAPLGQEAVVATLQFVAFVLFVFAFIVVAKTQRHLNDLWKPAPGSAPWPVQ